jgi:hypothetical protein
MTDPLVAAPVAEADLSLSDFRLLKARSAKSRSESAGEVGAESPEGVIASMMLLKKLETSETIDPAGATAATGSGSDATLVISCCPTTG